ncbi:CD80-like immunoglobulin C2-set [Trinorchestia longiramus]|nr:CD80-like immunoglobulin C2-set [Trinorchestia longiramus]
MRSNTDAFDPSLSECHPKVSGEEVSSKEAVKVLKSPTGGWISSLPLKSVRLGRYGVSEVIVECKASSKELDKATFASHLVTIVKPPGPPLLAKAIQQTVPEGSIVPVICTSVGGNPPPTIVISVGGQEITSEMIHRNGVTEARARVTARASDNGAAVLCEVSGPALTKVMTDVARLDVAFSPSRISGVAEPIEVDEGQETTLICETSSSNPVANITWRARGGRLLTGAKQRVSSGEHGGKITGSQMSLKAQAADNGQVFSCVADNGVTPPVLVNITTRVRHGPVWRESPSELVDVHEGDDLLVTAEAAANPGPIRYRWEHYGRLVSETGSELHISRISREEAGTYTVTATSPKGSINTSFTLDILYPPEDVHVEEKRFPVAEGGVANVECRARGNPKPKLYWSKHNSSYIEDKLSEGLGSARLVVKEATRHHTGLYYCHAHNALGTAPPVATAIIEMDINEEHLGHRIVYEYKNETFTAEAARNIRIVEAVEVVSGVDVPRGAAGGWAPLGGLGLLTCFVKAAPRPTFVWTTEDGTRLDSSDKYSVHSTQFEAVILISLRFVLELEDDLVLWSSRLEVRRVTVRDYGRYRCTAHNSLGAGAALYALHPPIPPPTPHNLTVVNVTEDSIVLAWTAGRPNRPAAYRNTISGGANEPRDPSGRSDGDSDRNSEVGGTGLPDAEYVEQSRTSIDAVAASQAYSSEVGYILQYRSELTGKHQVVEIAPGASTWARLTGLQAGVTYSFVVAASNEQGTSQPTAPIAFKMPNTDGQSAGGWRTPRLLLLILVVTGAALLSLNLAIIVCFLRRRARANSLSASSSKTTGIALYPGTPGSDAEGQHELLAPTPLPVMSAGNHFEDDEQTSSLAQSILLSPRRARSPSLSNTGNFKNNSDIMDLQVPDPLPSNANDSSCNEDNQILRPTTCQVEGVEDCFSPGDPNKRREKGELGPEICSLAESYCDGRSPCRAEDQISISSWHSYPMQCSHMRGPNNMAESPLFFNSQARSKHGIETPEYGRSMTPHQHHHPLGFNRSTFMPHQPSSLPEENSSLLDIVHSNSCRVQMQPRHHIHCHQKRISQENHGHLHPSCHSNFGHDHFHHHHHMHELHSQQGPSMDSILDRDGNPMRSSGNNERLPAYKADSANEGIQSDTVMLDPHVKNMLSPNYDKTLHDTNHGRINAVSRCNYPDKAYSKFSALNPADLCGYTSDTQDSRCCQGHLTHFGTLGPRPRQSESPSHFATLKRPGPKSQALHEGINIRVTQAFPDIQMHVSEGHRSPAPQVGVGGARVLMRSFSVDGSGRQDAPSQYCRSVDKPCSDYDNVSKYLINPNSAENIDKTRLRAENSSDVRTHFGEQSTRVARSSCQPFPTHGSPHTTKPSEPRVTFHEPIAETKTFHDPRLDDDDDFDEDSNVSSADNQSSGSNSIIYANNIVHTDTDANANNQNEKVTDVNSGAPKYSPSHLRSPPPSTFRCSSSTSSNASSSPSATLRVHRLKKASGQLPFNTSDTSSNSSCSSAPTASLSANTTTLKDNQLEGSKTPTKSVQNSFNSKPQTHVAPSTLLQKSSDTEST